MTDVKTIIILPDMINRTRYFYPIGQKIPGSFLTPVSLVERNGRMLYELLCDCGNRVFAAPYDLWRGKVKSCGCYKRKLAGERLKTHGLSTRPEYFAAHNVFVRCNNPGCEEYKRYGGRGIRVEFDSVENMAKWLISNLPKTDSHTVLDRIDNDGNYRPGNLRWATYKQSARNRRGSRHVTIGTETKLITDWAAESGVSHTTLHNRIKAGIPQGLWLHRGTLKRITIWKYLNEHPSETVSFA